MSNSRNLARLIVDSNGDVDSSALDNVVPAVGKNRIINGDMRIDQRNAGASVTPTTLYSQYTLDRWTYNGSQASKASVQQNAGSVTPPAGFTNYLGITSLSAYSVGTSNLFALNQYVEGYNIADFNFGSANAKTITLSFWVRSSLTGTFGGNLSNSANDRNYVFSYSINSANTWEYKTVTIAGDTTGTWLTTNGTGFQLGFCIGAGSNFTDTAGAWYSSGKYAPTGQTSVVGTSGATFYITGVQLEVGDTATDFERRLYGTELALCQRYHWQVNGTNSDQQLFGSGTYTTTVTTARILIDVPVNLRSIPSIEAANLRLYDPAGATTRSVTGWSLYATQQASSKVGIAFTVSSSSASPGDGCIALLNNSTSSRFALSAEL